MKRILGALAIFLIFVVGAIAYTWPAVTGIWEQRTDQFMSDGTDLTTSPYQFDMIHREYLKDPSLFFYGGFPNTNLNAPEGFVAWYSPIEKIAGALFPFFVPVEQVSALLALSLMVLNGLCLYGMGRAFGWSRLLSLGLAICWAFSAQTRARAQVHASLVGIYALPLAIWGLLILRKDRSLKGILKASLCFLGCVTSPHYYVIFLAIFSPFFIAFYFSAPEIWRNFRRNLIALVAAALPAVLFLTMSLLKPAPADFQKHVSHILPSTGKSQVWPHPFLEVFSAHFRDYFSGDIAVGTFDWNPLRAEINEAIRKDPRIGNFHEHAVGIRWVLWLFLIATLVYFYRRRGQALFKGSDLRTLAVFLSLGVFSFLCSLPPDWGFMWGPSSWIHWLVEQLRVPSRLAIFPYFSMLIVVGVAVHHALSHSKYSSRKRQVLLGIFILLIIIDFPPAMNSMPMTPIVPSRAPLVATKEGPCGIGMHFPHSSGNHNSIVFYYLLQSLRGTECSVLNPATPGVRDEKMIQLFGYQNPKMLQQILANDEGIKNQIVHFAQCNQLDWIVFDSRLPEKFVSDVCQIWGGKLLGQNFCRNQKPTVQVAYGHPDTCLAQMR